MDTEEWFNDMTRLIFEKLEHPPSGNTMVVGEKFDTLCAVGVLSAEGQAK